jgi:hypothetical protein
MNAVIAAAAGGPGDCDNFVCDVVGGAGDAINGAIGAVNYWSDPWGNTFKALQDAASSMAKDILPALTQATLPDLNVEWFLRLYAISFASAIFVAVVLIIPQVVSTARGNMAGRDLLESIGLYFSLFLAGAMFGPLAGLTLIGFFHALSDVFLQVGVAGSIDSTIGQLQSMIDSADPVGMTGGAPIAVVLMFGMVFALFMVLLVFLVQLVTQYFTGVLFPLGLVWIISKNRRTFGSNLAWLWLGLLAAHPLMFLLLSVAFSMMANQVATFGNNLSLQGFISLLVALIALLIAAFSPFLLARFAPVIPSGPAAAGVNVPSGSGGGDDRQIGPSNMSEATTRYGRGGEAEDGATSTSTSTMTATSETGEETDTMSGISASRAAAGADAPRLAGSGASQGAASGAGAATAGEGPAAAEGATVAEEAAAAGAAESSTGAGAVIGIPTLLAAGAMAATVKAAEATDQVGNVAAEPMKQTPDRQDGQS